MPRHYYGAVPALAWILNHYFYGGVHFNWLAAEFYPFRSNPNSSNPYVIYGLLYAIWKDDDPHDLFLKDLRKALQKGVDTAEKNGVLEPGRAERLRILCDHLAPRFFYPVLYRCDIGEIPPSRRIVAASGLRGSREYLVPDLREGEFDLLFTDNTGDPDFVRLVLDERSGTGRTSAEAVLAILERGVMK